MNLEEFIKNNNVDHTNNLILEEELEDILIKSKIQIGEQLKRYILKYGYLGFKHIEFFGINNNQKEKSNLIKQTMKLNEQYKETRGLIVFENQGDGDYYLIDSKDNVYRFISSINEITNQNLKLTDYILKRFKEVIKQYTEK